MAKFLMVGTKGPVEPTAATFPFAVANAALAQGHEVVIALRENAVLLMKEGVANTIRGMGMPPFKEVFATTLNNKIPILVCQPNALACGVTEDDLAGKNAQFTTIADAVKRFAEQDKIIHF